MTPRLTLVCHATTRALRAATFGGDDDLDDVGRRNVGKLQGSLERVDRCWTSPALRARETAAALGLSATADERLRDCHYGRWEGRTLGQVMLREPIRLATWIRNPGRAPHGGESVRDIVERFAAFLAERGHERVHTVAVTHAAVVRAAIVHVIQADLAAFWRLDVLPLSQAEFRSNGRRWVLRALHPLVPTEEPVGVEAADEADMASGTTETDHDT